MNIFTTLATGIVFISSPITVVTNMAPHFKQTLHTTDPTIVKFKVNNPQYFNYYAGGPYARYSIPNSINRNTQALAAYATSSEHTGTNILHWFDKYAPGFGSGDYQTGDYLSSIIWSKEGMMPTVWARKGFANNMAEPSQFLHKYIQTKSQSSIEAVFLYHYAGVLPQHRYFKVALNSY